MPVFDAGILREAGEGCGRAGSGSDQQSTEVNKDSLGRGLVFLSQQLQSLFQHRVTPPHYVVQGGFHQDVRDDPNPWKRFIGLTHEHPVQ